MSDLSDMVSRMVRNTPRSGVSWRSRLWSRRHTAHGAVIRVVGYPTFVRGRIVTPRYDRCGAGHERRVR